MKFLLLITKLAVAYESQDFVHPFIVSVLYTSPQVGIAAIVEERNTALELATSLQNETLFKIALQPCVGLGLQISTSTSLATTPASKLIKGEIIKLKDMIGKVLRSLTHLESSRDLSSALAQGIFE